jgi:hypothetical protein
MQHVTSVIHQDANRRPTPTSKNKQAARKGSFSWHGRASESMPLRPSTASIATKIRIWGVI